MRPRLNSLEANQTAARVPASPRPAVMAPDDSAAAAVATSDMSTTDCADETEAVAMNAANAASFVILDCFMLVCRLRFDPVNAAGNASGNELEDTNGGMPKLALMDLNH